MKRWWLVIALVLSVGVNLGILAVVLASRGTDREPERHRTPGEVAEDAGPRTVRLADRLQLAEPARRQFLDRHRAFFAETARLRLQMSESHRQLRHELTQAQPDAARIEQLQRSAADIYLALERQLAGVVADTRKMLTPEQEKAYLGIISRLGSDGFGFFSQPPRRSRLRQRPILDRLRGDDPAPPPPPPGSPPG